MFKRNLLICSVLLLSPLALYAGTSIYFCAESGAYGASWSSADDVAAAKASCEENGGTACEELLACNDSESGYAAIALSHKDLVIGVSCGAKTKASAAKVAMDSCKESGGTQCKVAHDWKH